MALEIIDDVLDLGATATTQDRILRAAATLLASGGRDAVTTRAVSAAAGVQPPTIYRQFGDMRGLLDAVAADGLARYTRTKLDRVETADPVADLRAGWDAHVAFGLANPALYALIYGEPRPGIMTPAATDSLVFLEALVRRVAEVGRLRVGVGRATRMIHAAGIGVVLSLIAVGEAKRDPALSTQTREAMLAAMITDASPAAEPVGVEPGHIAARAIALKAALPEMDVLTSAERGLLAEWLDRLSEGP